MLQLMAMFFHSHVRRKLASDLRVDGAALSAREFECLEGRPRQERLGHRTHSGNIASHCYLLPEQRESKIGSANLFKRHAWPLPNENSKTKANSSHN
jgi:hypothetical protein